MTLFVACDAAGAVRWLGECLPADLAHQVPPDGGSVVEITAAEGEVVRGGLAGWRVADGELAYSAPTVTLEQAKAAAVAKVDRAAEQARLRFITGGAGQALAYTAKEAEARSFVAPGADADYPYLAAERDAQADIGVSATLATVAAEVIAQADAWRSTGATIERLRRGAKLAIEAATSPEAIRAALAITWPTPG
ncbi:MAG: hypothetical protein ACOYOH_29010 [Paracraurococcus sp.]